MADETLEKFQRSTAVWSKWYERLQWSFPDEEAHEYAEELTQVAEGRKREPERSPHEIKREMKLLSNTEALINSIRLLVALGISAAPFCFILSRPLFLVPVLDRETVAATWIRVGLTIFCVVPGVVVWNRPFWRNWVAVLRRARLRYFWEWRSATLRFPIKTVIPSALFDTSQLPNEASDVERKPPHSSTSSSL
jgi:hypothetical protein